MPISDKNTSKIKMIGVLRGQNTPNITWYSIIKNDNQKDWMIIENMYKRFHSYAIKNKLDVVEVQFRNNKNVMGNDELLKTIY